MPAATAAESSPLSPVPTMEDQRLMTSPDIVESAPAEPLPMLNETTAPSSVIVESQPLPPVPAADDEASILPPEHEESLTPPGSVTVEPTNAPEPIVMVDPTPPTPVLEQEFVAEPAPVAVEPSSVIIEQPAVITEEQHPLVLPATVEPVSSESLPSPTPSSPTSVIFVEAPEQVHEGKNTAISVNRTYPDQFQHHRYQRQ